ncbi:MAG: DUF4389 domain-containing protein [Alphaproteobacteria bacterium]|nr:MAG: DUF4389 domain-containing protein [Alphaproteobacteria bacterium]
MSEETDPKNEPGTPEPAAKKPAARKRSAASAAKGKTGSTTAGAKKAAPRKTGTTGTASKKAAAPKAAAAPAPEPEVSEPAAQEETGFEADATASDAAQQGGTKTDAQAILSDLKEKDWAGYLVRGLFMLLFGFLAWVAVMFSFVLAAVQFVVLVIAGSPNGQITRAIVTLGNYIAEVMAYLSFKSDDRPFPLGKPLPVDD